MLRHAPAHAAVALARTAARAGAAAALAAALAVGAPAPVAAGLAPPNALVAEAWRVVDRNYVERTFNGADWFALRQARVGGKYASADDSHAAIRSMLAPLDDRFTRFLTPAQFASIESAARGGVVGVGIELSPLPEPSGGVRVTRVIEGSPAEEAGLKAGETIVRVDQQPLGPPLTADDIAAQIRGPPGSRVVLSIRAAGGEGGAVRDLNVGRAKVQLTSLKASAAKLGEKPVLLVELRSFSSETPAQLAAALASAAGQASVGTVIDLRGNGGGSLQGGIDAARLFLRDGQTIVSVADRTGVPRMYTAENAGAVDLAKPVALLINRDTASAAEVFAAALGENGRATLVGERSYGKGVIQTLARLEQGGGGGVAFTTARYRTPLGHDINKVGLPAAVAPTDAAAPGERADAQTPCLLSGGVGRPATECVPEVALRK
jgi:carboxyl-terminal processing protease